MVKKTSCFFPTIHETADKENKLNLSTISLKPKLCRGNSRFITKSHNWVDLTHLPRLRPPNMQTWGPNPLASIWRCDMLWLYTVDGQFSACLDLWNGMKTLQTTGKKHGSHYIYQSPIAVLKPPDFVHPSAERTFNSKDSKVQIGPAVRNHAIREVGVTHQHQCSCTITVRTSAGQWNNRLAPMKSVQKNHLVSKLKALIAFFGGWKIVWTTWRLGVVTNGLETSWAFCGRKRTTQNLIHSFAFGCFRHGYMSDKLNAVFVHEWYKNAYSTLWLRTAHMILYMYACRTT